MIPSLEPAASRYGDAFRELQRVLGETREQWDDAARHVFDGRYSDRIVTDARKTRLEMERLAQQLQAAARTLGSLD
jgi:hypothetical protein